MAKKQATMAVTAAWAIALVCFVILVLSLLMEHGIHRLHHYLGRRRRKTLILALHNLQAEIRGFGFMSLLLGMAEQPIADICVPLDVAKSFLPCRADGNEFADYDQDSKCPAEGKVPIISIAGMDQLLLLILVLAVSRIVTWSLAYALALYKVNKWAVWEEETRTLEYQLSHDPRRLILSCETSFARRHLKFWSGSSFLTWTACFFRHIFDSASKADYFTLRHSFIAGNFEDDYCFDFHKLVKRSLDHDFAAVTGNGHWSWVYGIVFIVFNAQRFRSYLYLPFIPLLMLLSVGTKLEVAVTNMCLDSSKEKELVPGTLCVKRDSKYFWFGKEGLLLCLLDFVLFQNSFQLAFLTWTWYNFGFPSCFHKLSEDIVLGIGVGVLIQVLCAYVTLPLYVLVSQMDSKMKKAIFSDAVIHGLKNWRDTARKNLAAEKFDPTTTPLESIRAGRPDNVVHGLRQWIDTARKNLATEGDKVVPATPPDSVRSSNRGSVYSDAHGDKNPESEDQLGNMEDTMAEMETRAVVDVPTLRKGKAHDHGEVSFELWTPSKSLAAENVAPTITTESVRSSKIDGGLSDAPVEKRLESEDNSRNIEDTVTEMETRNVTIPGNKDKAYDGEASFGTWHGDEDFQLGPPAKGFELTSKFPKDRS